MLAIVNRETDEVISYVSKRNGEGFRDLIKEVGYIDNTGVVTINGIKYEMDDLVLTNAYV